MSDVYFYFSLQYSAIQKTVLRHDRLWSIAGISQILSVLNELELPRITKSYNGEVLVAGGGKFTARFPEQNRTEAEKARKQIIKIVSTTLPMLEFQASEIIGAETLGKAKDKGLIKGLSEQKRRFRGYGVSYNPHMEVCEECGEYPAMKTWEKGKDNETKLCRICHQARDAGIDLKDILKKQENKEPLTSLESIYVSYWSELFKENKELKTPRIPTDFENLFPETDEAKIIERVDTTKERRRMAVWFSDANNMNSKVPIWLSQNDDSIPNIFKAVQKVNIDVIAGALEKAFPHESWVKRKDGMFLPFRLVVAGGDDLCLVTAEDHILDFALEFSKQVSNALDKLEKNPFLNPKWLEAEYQKYLETQKDKKTERTPPGPYCFGVSFVITPVHTPFKAIHSLGESLMSKAKKETNREADSINWQLLNVDEQEERESLLTFEKPLFIQQKTDTSQERSAIAERLTFEKYLSLRDDYRRIISGSQMKNIATALISGNGDVCRAELALIKSAVAAKEKGLTAFLSEQSLRVDSAAGKNSLDLAKVATLLELMNLKRRDETK